MGEATKMIQEKLSDCKTVIWNGPMGVFEFDAFAKGTFDIADTLAELTGKGCTTIIGGGDSVAAVEKLVSLRRCPTSPLAAAPLSSFLRARSSLVLPRSMRFKLVQLHRPGWDTTQSIGAATISVHSLSSTCTQNTQIERQFLLRN